MTIFLSILVVMCLLLCIVTFAEAAFEHPLLAFIATIGMIIIVISGAGR